MRGVDFSVVARRAKRLQRLTIWIWGRIGPYRVRKKGHLAISFVKDAMPALIS